MSCDGVPGVPVQAAGVGGVMGGGEGVGFECDCQGLENHGPGCVVTAQQDI